MEIDTYKASKTPPEWIPTGHDAYDWIESLRLAAVDTATAEPIPTQAEPIGLNDVASVEDFHVSYGDGPTLRPDDVPENDGWGFGTELGLVAILRLKDGRWASLSGWNDYTGWGCQDGASLRIGDSREAVERYGLDNYDRERLGLERVSPQSS